MLEAAVLGTALFPAACDAKRPASQPGRSVPDCAVGESASMYQNTTQHWVSYRMLRPSELYPYRPRLPDPAKLTETTTTVTWLREALTPSGCVPVRAGVRRCSRNID